MKSLILFMLVMFSLVGCRSKKVQRTTIAKDSVATQNVDSNWRVETNTVSIAEASHNYARSTSIHFSKEVKPLLHIDSAGNITVELPPIDSVIVNEKGRSESTARQETNKNDSGELKKKKEVEVHSSAKTVDKDIKPSYTWLYITGFVLLILGVVVYVILKIKRIL